MVTGSRVCFAGPRKYPGRSKSAADGVLKRLHLGNSVACCLATSQNRTCSSTEAAATAQAQLLAIRQTFGGTRACVIVVTAIDLEATTSPAAVLPTLEAPKLQVSCVFVCLINCFADASASYPPSAGQCVSGVARLRRFSDVISCRARPMVVLTILVLAVLVARLLTGKIIFGCGADQRAPQTTPICGNSMSPPISGASWVVRQPWAAPAFEAIRASR